LRNGFGFVHSTTQYTQMDNNTNKDTRAENSTAQVKTTDRRFYSIMKYILLLGVAGVLLWFSFRGVSWSEFKEGLLATDYRWIVLSMVIGILAFWLRALRWRLILLPLDASVKRIDTWNGVNIGYLTNFAVPRAGELARCGVITAKRKMPFETVAGTVVLERSIDIVTLLIASLLIFIFQWDRFGSFINREIISSLGARFSGSLIWVAMAIASAFVIFFYIVYKYRQSNPLFIKISKIAKGVISGIVSGFRMPQKWLFLFYTLAVWVCYWLMSYTTILAFPAVFGFDMSDALFLAVIGSFGWVIPVQGGIGAYHFIISLALTSIYGISQTTGMVFATISHESQALTMVICGVIALVSVSFGAKKSK
jgi:Predicted integral membrane protein